MTRLALLLMLLGSFVFVAAPTQAETPDAASTPIHIVKVWKGWEQFPQEYQVRLGVSFENLTTRTAVAIKFNVLFVDSFDKVLDTQSVVSYGKFSPNAVIDPPTQGHGRVQGLANGVGSSDNTSHNNAWTLQNTYGKQVAEYRFQVVSVRFEDGTIWNSESN